MSLTPIQQFQELLKKTTAPLILVPAYPSRDTLATAFALAHFLKNAGKVATVVGEHINTDKEILSFLTPPDNLIASLAGARDFVLSFNTARNKILNVRTENAAEELRIYITPQTGIIDPRDFSFIPAQFKFDLCVVIGAPDKEHLGKIYEENPDIFYEVPVVNLDHRSGNELFGQVNLVDITASSAAEILAEALAQAAPKLSADNVNECLLTGLIAATESFQQKNTTPKALKLASRLMDQGADQQKIVNALYKTESLHLLKLWGRVMSQMKWDEKLKLVLASVSVEDLVQSRARAEDLPPVLQKIKSSYATARLFILIYAETKDLARGLVKADTPETLSRFAQNFPEGTMQGDIFSFPIPANSLDEAEKKVIDSLSAKP